MARRTLLPVLAFVLLATPAFAVKTWYDHYFEATRGHMPAGRYQEAIKSLEEAVRLKAAPAVNEQTYGLQFIDYLPYYYMGVCYLRLGDLNTAIQMFNVEETRGAIKRTSLYKSLVAQRTEAENARTARVARLAREEVEKLLRDASDLARQRRYDDALAKLAQAQAVAASLDPATQQRVLDNTRRVRGEQRELAEANARLQRIEQGLADGRRLLEEGRPAEAIVRFDEVLSLEVGNGAAAQGKAEAQERILASTTRAARREAFQRGKTLFDAGRYQDSLQPLSDAAADPENSAARDLLAQAHKVVEGMKLQRERRVRIDALFEEAEGLLRQRKFDAASVRLREALELDPENIKGQERLAYADRMTGEEIFARWLPNQPPSLTFFEPRGLEMEGPTVGVYGVATDDRGVARIEFRLGNAVVAEQAVEAESSEAFRHVRFEREFPMRPGANDLTVTVVDSSGVARSESFRITRHLRFYETRAFLPSAFALALGLVGTGFGVQRVRRRRAVRRRFNPYIAGAPVMRDDMFFGRTKLMARMMNVLHHNSLMITGERRIGKTTFLFHLKKALESDEGGEYRFFPVLTDLQGVGEQMFFHSVMSDVLESLKLDPSTTEALRFRHDATEYDGRHFSHDLQKVIDELKTRTSRNVKLALLIDEVDALNEYSERVNQRLRSIFMKTFSEHLVAVMSGVGIKRTWKSEGSPWYNFFDEIELSAFDRDEAEALIRTPVEGYFRYEPEAVQNILEWSDLKPYVVQKFCVHAVNRMLEEGRTVVTSEDVTAVREIARFDPGEAVSEERPHERVVAD
jgi:tetratricopeptide (TPR) repeat protein